MSVVVDGMLVPAGNGPLSLIQKGHFRRAAEFLKVIVHKIGTKKFCKIPGSIDLRTPSGVWSLYHREDEHMCPVDGLPADLTHRLKETVVPLMPHDTLDMTFDLTGDLEELNKETVSWVPDSSPCDQLILEEVSGNNYSLLVTYIVYEKVLIANFEIKLLRADLPPPFSTDYIPEEPGAYLFGHISASSTRMSESISRDLLDRRSGYFCVVLENEAIPLSRPSLCIPFGSGIDIRLNLFSFPDLLIARAIVHVMPKYLGEYVATVSNPYFDVQVKVAFCV